MEAGLQSIPGGGAEILDDEVRSKIARLKCTSEDWENMHRTAHKLGLRTTATMMFGCGEELRHRVNHFERIRRIQEDTGGFTAFIPWIFASDNTPLGKKVQETTAVDYLKTLAVSRLYLDNIDHIQSSWLTPGIKVCQVGLQFGADDVGRPGRSEQLRHCSCDNDRWVVRGLRGPAPRPQGPPLSWHRSLH